MSQEVRNIVAAMQDKKSTMLQKIAYVEGDGAFSDVDAALKKWDPMKYSSAEAAVRQTREYIGRRILEFREKADGVFERLKPKSFGEYTVLKNVEKDKDPIYVEAAPLATSAAEDIVKGLNDLADHLEVLEKFNLPTFEISQRKEEILKALTPIQKAIAKDIQGGKVCQYSLENLVEHYQVTYGKEATTASILPILEILAKTNEWELAPQTKNGRTFDYILRRRGLK